MRINFRPNREKGLTLLGLILFIVALVIICGIIIYIITRISRIPPRQLPDESITITTDPAVVQQITGSPPPTVGTGARGISASFVTPTAEGDSFEFVPFTVIIERTTNFLHWEGIQTNRVDGSTPSGQITSFSDTNVFPQAFYRAHYIYD